MALYLFFNQSYPLGPVPKLIPQAVYVAVFRYLQIKKERNLIFNPIRPLK